MKFSLLNIDQIVRLRKLSRNKTSFLKKDEDVSLFHFNHLENDLYHVVFNINDEYSIGTRKLGQKYNYPYSSLVNLFFLKDKQFALLEYLNDEYREEVLDYIRKKTKVNISKASINQGLIANIYEQFNGTVKKIEYTNDDGELFDKDFINSEKFYKIMESNHVDRVTYLIEDNFLSISSEGVIVVDNSDEDFLIKFTKRILNVIE